MTSIAFGNFDMTVEDFRVLEDEFYGGNRHGLGNGDKVENALLLDAGHVEKALVGVLQGVEDHFRAAL